MQRSANFFPVGRARGVTIAVEGFFAFMWFGWGQAAAPSWLVIPLGVGTVLGAVVGAIGVAIAARATDGLAATSDPSVRRRYGITVGIEFALIGAGAAVLAATGLADWIAVWVCLIVGIHFFPLAEVLNNPSLRPLGLLITAAAALAWVVELTTTVAPSTITGPGAGTCLLAFGLATLATRSGVPDRGQPLRG